ncbi:MAG: YciI family protein [Myxococcota bacterium]
MKVMMLILESPDDFKNRGDTPAGKEYWAAWQAYSQTISDKLVGGNILAGVEAAATLRMRGGERVVQDGPFAESKEALGGYMIFEVESMDEALELAASCPAAATGAVELRPIVEMSAM